jgi:hypothetical protein
MDPGRVESDVTLQKQQTAEGRNIVGLPGEKNFGSERVFLYLTGTLYG